MTKILGDPDCICGGTGLVCRLGEDLNPDPESIAICDCVPRLAAKRERERLGDVILIELDMRAELNEPVAERVGGIVLDVLGEPDA